MRPSGAWRWLLPAAAVVVALIAGVVTVRSSVDDGGGRDAVATTAVPADAVEVASDAPVFATLEELLGASDLVVRGRITDVQRGRWFGEGGDGARIRSRLASLEVDEVLAGTPRGETGRLLLEEEGWTEDGRVLVIDGAVPTQLGDEGIWFLTDTGDATTGAWIVVNAQGRYLDVDGELQGARGDDPLVAELASGSLDELADRISRSRPRP